MDDDAFSFYCKNFCNLGSTCELSDLIIVKILREDFNNDGDCTAKEIIYKCVVCGGFYKRKYSAIYYHPYNFDTEEGWSIVDKYFKIEEPLWKTLGSTGKPPLTLDEARHYGFTGKDHTWKNGRCNFPAQNVELTCRAIDLQFVAFHESGMMNHNSNKFYKCKRCGEWYFFIILPPYNKALLKPSNENFPLEEAKFHGF